MDLYSYIILYFYIFNRCRT